MLWFQDITAAVTGLIVLGSIVLAIIFGGDGASAPNRPSYDTEAVYEEDERIQILSRLSDEQLDEIEVAATLKYFGLD